MTWLYLVLIANLLGAFVVLIDKYLVGPRAIGRSEVYTFYIGILSSVVLVMVPFGSVSLPSLLIILISLIVGFGYMTSIIYFYKALQISDASDVAPVLGATAALSAFVFQIFFFGSTLSSYGFLAFILLVLGTAMMSYFRFNKKSLICVLVAGVLFGYSSIFLKILFDVTTFANGFFWSRMANVVGALMLLVVPLNREIIIKAIRTAKRSTTSLVFVNKIIAGSASFLSFVAIKMSSAPIVNALGGMPFVFLLAMAHFFPKFMPQHFETIHERRDYEASLTYPRNFFFYKMIATIFIVFGFLLLFQQNGEY